MPCASIHPGVAESKILTEEYEEAKVGLLTGWGMASLL